MIVGTGNHRYQAVPSWGAERTLGIASGVATDSQDRVYVVEREPNPAIVVYDRDGHFIAAWGQDILALLQTIGAPHAKGSDGQPFNQPTRVIRHPSGELMVSDGYGQCYLHRLSADGELLQTWGGPSNRPHGAHGIWVDRHGDIYVGEVGVENLIHKFQRV